MSLEPTRALVTKDRPASTPTEDFHQVLTIVKSSSKSLQKATYGRGGYAGDTFLAKTAEKLRDMMPEYEIGFGFFTYGLLAGVTGAAAYFGLPALGLGALAHEVAFTVGGLAASPPVAAGVTAALSKRQKASAVDKLMPDNAPKALDTIASEGSPLARAVVANEAQRWMTEATHKRALSPEARFQLEDLVATRGDVSKEVLTRAGALTQLARIITSDEPINESVVRDIGRIVAQLDPAERRDVVRAISAEIADRKAPDITYEARHALADLARVETKALPAS